jgi:hypothetical protein
MAPGHEPVARRTEAQNGFLPVVTIGLNNHKFAPGLPVVGLLTSPCEVRLEDVRVGCARINVFGQRLFEGVGNGVVIEPDPTELLRSQVGPRSSQRV